MELGIYSFGDRRRDAATGRRISDEQRIKELLEEARLADEVGLDVFGVGEHHRDEYVVSAPPVVLAAVAAQTKRIRLTSAVTVLSSDDPVRVLEQFHTVDLISGGRAEIMAGRGSFIESFPLFGYDLEHYDELFAEKLELLLALREGEPVTWQGQLRAPLEAAEIHPGGVQRPIPVWVAIGGNPPSVARAGLLGLPLAIAIIGGQPARMAPLADLHRRALAEGGHGPQPIAIAAHGFVADSRRAAADALWPSYAEAMTQIGRERGWPPARRAQFDLGTERGNHLYVGEPEFVAQKILDDHEVFGHDRHSLQMDVGGVPHAELMRSIELFGTKVAPLVREEVARRVKQPA
ncbi:MAG: LLM class flavin-dependent oxidoreductase [Solirubrobacteraceae bacterium]|nr:LLM class flavin-dependent oxidoreductase [Solirubrobacteraceae bacterium]